MNLTPRQRKVLKVVGFIALGLIAFVFALAQTFPYDRIKDRMIDELSDKYDVEIGDVHAGWMPGTIIIEDLSLTTRPTKPEEKATTIYVDEVEVDIGLLALITRKVVVNVTASVAGGEIEVGVEMSKNELDVSIKTSSLPLDDVPGLAGAVGLPMGGPLDAEIELEVPVKMKGKRQEFKWTEAEGRVSIQCNGCTIGDGKAKLKMKPRATKSKRRRSRQLFAAEGITVPKLRLGDAAIEIEIIEGIGKINAFSAKSKDGELSLDGELRFAEPFKRSTLPGCLRFKLSEELKKREPNFGNIEFTLRPTARQDDGSFAIPTKGTLGRFGLNHRKRCSDSTPSPASGSGNVARPSLKAPPPSKPERTGVSRGDDVKPPEPGEAGPDLGAARLRDVAQKAADAKAKEEEGDKGDGNDANGDDQGDDQGDDRGDDQGEEGDGQEGDGQEGDGEEGDGPEGDGQEGDGEGQPEVN